MINQYDKITPKGVYMKSLFSTFLLLMSLSSFAQDYQAFDHEHNGGNGGDDDEIMIKNTLLQIGMFLDSSDGQTLFAKDVNSKLFLNAVKNADIRVVEQTLTDKFEMKRCALNFPLENLVVFNRGCLDNLRNNVNDLYVLLTHEILNIMGLELPDTKGGSVYPISTRIGAVGPLVIAKSKNTLFSSHCQLEIRDWNYQKWNSPKMIQNILKDKGFTVVNNKSLDAVDTFFVTMNIKAQKYADYKIEGNQITFSNGKTDIIESSFLRNNFDGLIVLRIEGTDVRTYAPTPVKVQTAGDQYLASPKGFWKESIIEAFMKLPSCVRY